MLEQMRRSSRSLLIYTLFGIVIAVFVVNFGPQSGGGCDARTGDDSFAAKVAGRVVTQQDYRYGYVLAGGSQVPPQIARERRFKESIMDKLIERELLASEAERLGIRVSDEEVEDFIAESKLISLGYEQSLSVVQKDGKFDYDLFRRFVQYQLGMTPRSFIDQQRREMMAARVRDILKNGVNVSVDEVKADFERRENQVNVEYVRFASRKHESDLEIAPKEIETYAAANEKSLKDLYEQRKFLYEKAPKEKKLRQILIKVASGAAPAVEEAAKKKSEAIATRIRGGQSFAAVAKNASEDTGTKARGGALGWRRQGATSFGTVMEGKVWEAKDGTVVGPERGPDGFYLALSEETREGDIPFEKVRLELAEEQLRQEKAKNKARAEAEAALAKAKAAPTKALKDLFPAPKEPSSTGAADLPQADETGLVMRRGNTIEGIGTSPEMAKQLFALTGETPFAGPVDVGGSFVIAKLKERKHADTADFEKRKMELVREASAVKGETVVEDWALRRCVDAKEGKKIQVNLDLLRYEAGPEGTPSYEPCTPPSFRL